MVWGASPILRLATSSASAFLRQFMSVEYSAEAAWPSWSRRMLSILHCTRAISTMYEDTMRGACSDWSIMVLMIPNHSLDSGGHSELVTSASICYDRVNISSVSAVALLGARAYTYNHIIGRPEGHTTCLGEEHFRPPRPEDAAQPAGMEVPWAQNFRVVQ